jgi:hypothetical protein
MVAHACNVHMSIVPYATVAAMPAGAFTMPAKDASVTWLGTPEKYLEGVWV